MQQPLAHQPPPARCAQLTPGGTLGGCAEGGIGGSRGANTHSCELEFQRSCATVRIDPTRASAFANTWLALQLCWGLSTASSHLQCWLCHIVNPANDCLLWTCLMPHASCLAIAIQCSTACKLCSATQDRLAPQALTGLLGCSLQARGLQPSKSAKARDASLSQH